MMSQAINEEQKERSLHALNPMVLLALIVFLCFLASYIGSGWGICPDP